MNRKYKTIFFTLLLALISTGQLHAESFRGKLVDVLSGDTVEILHDGKAESVRLAQIYAPVKGQPFGVAAKNFILRIASNENVTVRFDAYDLYGMPLGEVFLSGGTNLNKLIVSAGYAWRYEGYSNDPDYVDLEVRAREAGLGLWGVKDPVPPWEWRPVANRAASMRASAVQAPDTGFVCGNKQYCHEMSSCEEAKFYLYACGLNRLDRDGNGVPCEPKCK
ncbi:MAG TPA: thermonuclease family protein [Geobacteraceae bacterium]|jgi:endonuclease YncB( thermonuclease family)|nr:thermonuclease family protein [Geobacteraceae bacterium]